MKKDIESILSINRYIIGFKNDNRKTELLRRYLRSKVDSALNSKFKPNVILTNFLNIPLSLLSI